MELKHEQCKAGKVNITPKGGRVAVGPFMTDEKGGVVRMVHLMYRCNKRGIRRGEFQFTSNLMLGW